MKESPLSRALFDTLNGEVTSLVSYLYTAGVPVQMIGEKLRETAYLVSRLSDIQMHLHAGFSFSVMDPWIYTDSEAIDLEDSFDVWKNYCSGVNFWLTDAKGERFSYMNARSIGNPGTEAA